MGEKNEPYESPQLVKQEELRTITASTRGRNRERNGGQVTAAVLR